MNHKTDMKDPSVTELINCIEQGYCPWCDKKGLKMLSSHSSQAHQIYASDIRIILKVIKTYPTCSKEMSHEKSRQAYKMGLPLIGATKGGRKLNTPTEMSEAGLVTRRINIAKIHKLRTTRHNCPACGKEIIGYRPLFCSIKCRNTTRLNNIRKEAQ